MTPTLDRLATEQRFHDAQAEERAAAFRTGQADLRFADADYLDHESWIRPALAQLGDPRGKRALDFGCGHGMAAVVMARSGAEVHAFDLSPKYVVEANARAAANGVAINAVVANGEKLPYPDGHFDSIWGCAILHHLDLAKAARELHRVLKPGGVAVFCEPWGGNPLLAFARRWLPYPGKHRTPDERPLVAADLDPIHEVFPKLRTEGHQLLGMVGRVTGRRCFTRTDRFLMKRIPVLEKWSRYLVLVLPKG